MPQISTKPQEAKKLISASLPQNISAVDKAALEAKWNNEAKERAEAVSRESKVPTEASTILKYEVHKFGRHWVSYQRIGRKLIPLMPAPSIPETAQNTMMDRVSEDMTR